MAGDESKFLRKVKETDTYSIERGPDPSEDKSQFESFSELYLQDPVLVSKFELLTTVQTYFTISFLLIMMTPGTLNFLGYDVEAWVYSHYPSLQGDIFLGFSGMTIALVSIASAGTVVFFLMIHARYSYGITGGDVRRHYLAKAVSDYEKGDYKTIPKYLEKYDNSKSYANSYPLILRRENQITKYTNRLSRVEDSEEVVGETFEGVFGPFITEVLLVDGDNKVETVIGDIETTSEGPAKASMGSVAMDIFNPLLSSKGRSLILLGLVVLTAVGAGHYFGKRWAVIILGALTLYYGGIKS